MKLTAEQEALLAHALGLHTESGGFRARRNHYYSQGNCSSWDSLVDKGLAIRKRVHRDKKIVTYMVTESGLYELGRIRKVTISLDVIR